MSIERVAHPDAQAAAADLARAVAADLRAGIEARGSASAILGASPGLVAFLQALRAQPLDWSRVTLVPSDECWVDARDPDSREGLLRRHLLRDAVLDARLVTLRTDDARPLAAIAQIGERLSRLARPFDAVVLEAGAAGEVAALHPGMAGLEAMLNPRWAVQAAPARAPDDPRERVTLTLRALLDARRVHVLLARHEPLPAGSPADAVLARARVPLRVVGIDGGRAAGGTRGPRSTGR